MIDETREMMYTGANLAIVGVVLMICMLFLGLRSKYADTVTETTVAKERVSTQLAIREYDFGVVDGFDVMNLITAYNYKIPMYAPSTYNYVTGGVRENILYTRGMAYDKNGVSLPEYIQITVEDPLGSSEGLQNNFREGVTFYTILTYDSDTPEQLAKDMGITTMSGRRMSGSNKSHEGKRDWLHSKYAVVRPNVQRGTSVSGVLIVCIDLEDVSTITYNKVAIY